MKNNSIMAVVKCVKGLHCNKTITTLQAKSVRMLMISLMDQKLNDYTEMTRTNIV